METRPNHIKDATPLCASCTRSMSPRDNGDWFCPGCAEYGRYVGMIRPESPEHPAFYDDCKSSTIAARELLIGCELQFSEYGSTKIDYLGEITGIGESLGKKVVMVEREPAEPFQSQITTIEYEQFFDWWKRPRPGRREQSIAENENTFWVI